MHRIDRWGRTYILDILNYRIERVSRDSNQQPHISNPLVIADNLTLYREFSGPTASRHVESKFQSLHRAGVVRRLCIRFQAARSSSIRIVLLLGHRVAAERRTSGLNHLDFVQTHSMCQPIGELAQPSPTILTPRFLPSLSPPDATVTGIKAAFLMRRKFSGGSIC